MSRATLFLCSCAILSGCSSGNSGDGGVSGDQACEDLGTAYCNTYGGCSAYELARIFGSLSTCVSQMKTSCTLGLGAPQNSRTPATVEACSVAYQTWTCDDLFANVFPAACAPTAGGLSNGSVCTTSFQCQSTFCQVPVSNAVCGTCQPPTTAGASCATLGCSHGFVCGTDSQLCLVAVTDGGSCTDENGCLAGLACFGFDGGNGSGTCVPSGTAGDTCDTLDVSAPRCENRQSYECLAKVCAAVSLASTGAACGEIDAGPRPCPDGGTSCIVNEEVNCTGNGDCVEAQGAASCVGPAANGAACDNAVGPPCLTPAKCVADAGTAGVCEMPDPSLCAG